MQRDGDGRLVGRPSIDTIWNGKRVRAVGSGIFLRPPEETNHEFYVLVLADTLGDEWERKGVAKPVRERHVVKVWMDELEAVRRGDAALEEPGQREDGARSGIMTGDLKALVSLSYDVYTLRHATALDADGSIVKRLRHADQFQGARYELAVAAVFSRAGYEIDWIDETSRKRPEFLARDVESGDQIAVEAKSRHREGALGFAHGQPTEGRDLRPDVGKLLKAALEKATDGLPYVICLDLNLPDEPGGPFQDQVRQLHDEVLADFGSPSAEAPDPFSAIFFTNYSWHWQGTDPAESSSNTVVVPRFAEHPIELGRITMLGEALQQYGDVPPG